MANQQHKQMKSILISLLFICGSFFSTQVQGQIPTLDDLLHNIIDGELETLEILDEMLINDPTVPQLLDGMLIGLIAQKTCVIVMVIVDKHVNVTTNVYDRAKECDTKAKDIDEIIVASLPENLREQMEETDTQ